MKRKAYPSDLSNAEWQIIEPLIPPAKPGGRPRKHIMREILNAIFYILRSGCAWRMLPTTCHPGKQSIITSVNGKETELGNA